MRVDTRTSVQRSFVTLDGNEACAYVAHKLSEVVAIYPITPSSVMGEWADEWTAEGRPKSPREPSLSWSRCRAMRARLARSTVPSRQDHSRPRTASQGLLLMIPNMYRIAGELTPTVFHVAARSIAAQGLSIFGDHQDVMAVRQTGWALLASGNVQEAQDLALIAHAATLRARVPFLHFFDGFRTSHEVMKSSVSLTRTCAR
jgi:pyruvate-ferredoxin/flavodoxin oxidoreductase